MAIAITIEGLKCIANFWLSKANSQLFHRLRELLDWKTTRPVVVPDSEGASNSHDTTAPTRFTLVSDLIQDCLVTSLAYRLDTLELSKLVLSCRLHTIIDILLGWIIDYINRICLRMILLRSIWFSFPSYFLHACFLRGVVVSPGFLSRMLRFF